MAENFFCSVHDLLHKHGFLEGDLLIPEEEPLVEQACEYLAHELGIVENRWKPEIRCGRYLNFIDLTTDKTVCFYEMPEVERRKILKVIEQKNLDWIKIPFETQNELKPNKVIEKKMTTIQDDIWTILHEIAKGQKELQIAQKENESEIVQLRESQKETNEQIAQLQESIKETNASLKRVGVDFGNMKKNQGDVAEEFFFNSLLDDPHLGEIHFDDIAKSQFKHRGKVQEEYDIVMTNGNAVGIIEVKYKAHENDLDKLERKMKNFKKLFPVYENYKLYGAIASFHLYDEAIEKALERGFFVLQRSGNVVQTNCGENLLVL